MKIKEENRVRASKETQEALDNIDRVYIERLRAENLSNEKEFLDKVVETYVTSESSQDRLVRELAVRTAAPFMDGHGHALELGCSDGYMTALIAKLVDTIDVIDGSKKFLEATQKRLNLSNANFIYALFEEYTTETKYDYVFATYILEHVIDPVQVLKMVHSVLKPDGKLFIVVPNANALSRQHALHMGVITGLKNLTQNDLNHGHRRVYDRVDINRDVAAAGFTTISQTGILLKPFADFQMNKLIDSGILQQQQLDGLYSLGFEYPDLCGTLFSACKKA